MLKKIEVTSNHTDTRGTTTIDYSYQYDSNGFPTVQKGDLKSETYRSEPTQFGVPLIIKSPINKSFEKTMNYSCE
ncbi:hypothetical protein BC749_10939 [Flavobacterium araucananum]|nr:hypothetical protein BC749_10939 [Flavobacterium araucananum]